MKPAFAKRLGATQLSPHPLVSEYLSATELTHDWANLTGWATTGVQVNSNRLYGITGGNPSATATAFSATSSETVKVTAEVVLTTTSPGMVFVGLNFGGTNNGVNASAPNFVGIGVGTATKLAAYYIGSNFTGVTTGQVTLASSIPNGTYRATVVADAQSISIVLQSQDSDTEWSMIIPRSSAPNSGAITSLLVWNGATNGTSGNYVKAIGAKKSLTPFRTKTNSAGTIEGNTDFVLHRNNGDNWRVQMPSTMNGMSPMPVAVYFHQASTGTRNSPMSESRWEDLRHALLSEGYILVSADDGGDRWGNAASVANYASLVSWIFSKVYCSKVFLIGCSMGGLGMWNMITHKAAYPIAAAVGICPVCDLVAMYGDPTFTASVGAAYSAASEADLIANSAGYDPVQEDGYKFRRIPYLVNVGASDTIVPAGDHIDVLGPIISPYAVSLDVEVIGTGHLQAAQYDATAIPAFFNAHKV